LDCPSGERDAIDKNRTVQYYYHGIDQYRNNKPCEIPRMSEIDPNSDETTVKRQPGRPKLGRRRLLIVADDQWLHWQGWAEANHESVSEMLRRLADRETGWPKRDANGS
jgi:hypothetical protein